MIRIDVNFDALRERLYDYTDAAIDFGTGLVGKFNEAFDGVDAEPLDIESVPVNNPFNYNSYNPYKT